MSGYREDVERGAAYLDRRVPGWRDRIDLDRLELHDCTRCVLGQLAGDENPLWFEIIEQFGVSDVDELLFGFNLEEPDDQDWTALTVEWRDYIRETRAGAA